MRNIIKHIVRIYLVLSLGVSAEQTTCSTNNHLVIIIPSRNNSQWCERNLNALITQNYDNWHAIYINDASTDDTKDKVEQFIRMHRLEDKIMLINNEERLGAMANIYKAVYMCNNQDVAILYDGDDWFSGPNVLRIVNQAYADNNVWLTFGSYQEYPSGKKGGSASAIPKHIVESNRYRQDHWRTSHLRTFYAWLFKRVKTEDFKIDGVFLPMTYDQAIMFPLLELAGGRFKYIPDILYIYNLDNPVNDHKVDAGLQMKMEKLVRSRTPYQSLGKILK